MEVVVPVSVVHSARRHSSPRSRAIAFSASFLAGLMCAIFLLNNIHQDGSKSGDLDSKPAEMYMSKLSMAGDIATLKDIHAAYIRGSVPTATQESEEIMNQQFSDEADGSDQKSRVPSAYITGTVSTAEGEARDITSFASSSAARDRANKDVARTESLLQVASKPVLTKLSMAGDISTLKDIHAAYVRGSVSTAAQESDDIMNQPYPDERDGSDKKSKMPNAYITGSVSTAEGEARDITSFASSSAARDRAN
mmetsp:Transcript_35802/g.93937  ORF Transcript_35802/g.93937 Transcript_35802/m.93937 type:complete len:252 (+) Transcript_35802:13-768(+)